MAAAESSVAWLDGGRGLPVGPARRRAALRIAGRAKIYFVLGRNQHPARRVTAHIEQFHPMKNKSALLLIVLSASLCVSPLLRAEDAPKPDNDTARPARGEKIREHMKERREHAVEELGLNADQQAKWKAIGQQEKTALEALKADTTLSKEQRHAKAEEIHKSFANQRDTLLTPEQKQKKDAMKDKMKERMKERREKRKGGDEPK